MILVLIAALVGMLLPVQAGVNAQLRFAVGHPLWAAFTSFLGGTLALGTVLLLARVPFAGGRGLAGVPGWQLTGGLLGATYIVAAVILAPRLGAATLIASVVLGQLVASLTLDHFGWIGFPVHSASLPRIAGAVLVLAGVLLLRR